MAVDMIHFYKIQLNKTECKAKGNLYPHHKEIVVVVCGCELKKVNRVQCSADFDVRMPAKGLL